MNTNLKKAILIFGGGLLVYWAFKKIKPIGSNGSKKTSSSTSTAAPTEEQKKNAAIALKAYQDAQEAGESVSFLGDMNKEFAKEFGVRVQKEKGSGSLFASDLKGNKIL